MLIDTERLLRKCIMEKTLDNKSNTLNSYMDLVFDLKELNIDEPYNELIAMRKDIVSTLKFVDDIFNTNAKLSNDKLRNELNIILELRYWFEDNVDSHILMVYLTNADPLTFEFEPETIKQDRIKKVYNVVLKFANPLYQEVYNRLLLLLDENSLVLEITDKACEQLDLPKDKLYVYVVHHDGGNFGFELYHYDTLKRIAKEEDRQL